MILTAQPGVDLVKMVQPGQQASGCVALWFELIVLVRLSNRVLPPRE
jgi:hypothetical protein